MSLLNKMLNDLEKRQATAGAEQSMPQDVFLSSPKRRSFNGPLILALVVAGAGILVWINYQKPGTQPPVQVAAVKSPPKANPLPAKPVSATENGLLPSSSIPAIQAASEVVAKLPAPPAAPQQPATKSEAVVVAQKGSASTPAVTSAPQGNAKAAVVQAATKPVMVAMANEKTAKGATAASGRDKPASKATADPASSFKVVRPQQKSNNLYKQAILLLQHSQTTEAQNALRQAIDANSSNHGARQLLAELLADAGRNAEAATLLREGLDISPGDGGFSMALARLQVANGAKEEALSTLEQGMSSAEYDVEYHAFIAALLQNQGRHDEAIQHYITALRSNPSMPGWLIGVGISLQAENKLPDAAEAFQRAINTGELTSEVAQFADQQLKQIRQH